MKYAWIFDYRGMPEKVEVVKETEKTVTIKTMKGIYRYTGRKSRADVYFDLVTAKAYAVTQMNKKLVAMEEASDKCRERIEEIRNMSDEGES